MAEDQAEGKPTKRTNNGGKRSGFMAKLYDDEAMEDEMRVFDMENGADQIKEIEDASDDDGKINKRDKKVISKKGGAKGKSREVAANKISKLNFSLTSLGLFAICEISKGYAIVNYTRNTKGYISLKGHEELAEKLKVGSLIVASVLSSGTSKYNTETSGHKNRKLQLAINPDLVNKSLTAENLQANMLLQGIIESKEAKGFLIDFGLKDKTKGFLPFTKESEKFSIGQITHVLIKSVMAGSKVAKCELIS